MDSLSEKYTTPKLIQRESSKSQLIPEFAEPLTLFVRERLPEPQLLRIEPGDNLRQIKRASPSQLRFDQADHLFAPSHQRQRRAAGINVRVEQHNGFPQLEKLKQLVGCSAVEQALKFFVVCRYPLSAFIKHKIFASTLDSKQLVL